MQLAVAERGDVGDEGDERLQVGPFICIEIAIGFGFELNYFLAKLVVVLDDVALLLTVEVSQIFAGIRSVLQGG